MRQTAIAASIVGALYSTDAHSENRYKIPNGETNGMLSGHGGGDGGLRWSFKDAGNVWSKDLCEMDTDGDGQSNGLELGDPCCVWSIGADEAALVGFMKSEFSVSADPAGISIAGLSSSMTTRTMPDCTRAVDISPPPPSLPAVDAAPSAPACPEGCAAVGIAARARLLLFAATPSCPIGCEPARE